MISHRRKMSGGSLLVMAAACAAATCSAPPRAFAQDVVLIVNGDLITDYDIEQRSKLFTLTNSAHKQPPRQQVIENLIDDKLKVQIGRRHQIELTDSDVDRSYAEMAHRMNGAWTADQLTQALGQAGVDAATLKARIMADLAWRQAIIRGKSQLSLLINEKNVLARECARLVEDGTTGTPSPHRCGWNAESGDR